MEYQEQAQRSTRSKGRGLRRFQRDQRGFAGAEAVLLALILCGICIVAGTILRKAALQAATNLNNELAGSK